MTSETDRLVLEALRGLSEDMAQLRARVDGFTEKTSDGFHQLREELIEEIHALRDETREALRVVKVEVEEVRDDVKDVRLATVKNGLAIEHLDERVEMLRESTMTSLGFSAQVNLQQKKLAKQLTELSARVERLENSK